MSVTNTDFITAKFRCLSRDEVNPHQNSWGDAVSSTSDHDYYALHDDHHDGSAKSNIRHHDESTVISDGSDNTNNLTSRGYGRQYNYRGPFNNRLLSSFPSINFNGSKIKKRLTFILFTTLAIVVVRLLLTFPSLIRTAVFGVPFATAVSNPVNNGFNGWRSLQHPVQPPVFSFLQPEQRDQLDVGLNHQVVVDSMQQQQNKTTLGAAFAAEEDDELIGGDDAGERMEAGHERMSKLFDTLNELKKILDEQQPAVIEAKKEAQQGSEDLKTGS